jgi:hypothetical protein
MLIFIYFLHLVWKGRVNIEPSMPGIFAVRPGESFTKLNILPGLEGREVDDSDKQVYLQITSSADADNRSAFQSHLS